MVPEFSVKSRFHCQTNIHGFVFNTIQDVIISKWTVNNIFIFHTESVYQISARGLTFKTIFTTKIYG